MLLQPMLKKNKQSVYSSCQDGIRRGRPRADTVRELISEGETSSSRIRCNICNRVFPREKSLQAHKRTHTGERDRAVDAVNILKSIIMHWLIVKKTGALS